ncbi:MAG: thioesterase family protein [Brevundimonas sp.]|uniref:acyl-CoA thioesterase n=1 Tax=Brevundimonas sp. TaxID=1871086 RepID=UPI00271D98A4|nr:thioesterase family protein [Brevundimonas sp.]MDO9587620.1 thioesterase family protein [Brevundimonas sp.]
MTQQTLAEALSLIDDGAGGLTARLSGGFSNAPQSAPQERGAPFGGLMAALAAGAMRQGLDIETPLQSLTIQYLAAARFEEVVFTPVMTRGGRNVAYASVIGGQGDRAAVQALGTFGRDVAGPALTALTASPPPVDTLESTPLNPRFGPWFSRHIDHRFVAGPKLFGENAGRTPELGCWMRTADAAPLDEARLLFLLDGLYPTYFTAFPAPPVISASVDLRADLLTAITPETSPEGWAYFHFTSRDVGGGWAVEDGVAWAPDGRPLALVRQRRKLLPTRPPHEA